MVLGQPGSVLSCLLSAGAKHVTGIRLNVVRTSVILNRVAQKLTSQELGMALT